MVSNRKKLIVLVAILAALVLIGLFFVLSGRVKTPGINNGSNTNEEAPQAQITYTDAGFQPPTITMYIESSGILIFTNESTREVTITSSDNELKVGSIKPRDVSTYKSVTVTEPGVYTFSNSSNPQEAAQVEVFKQ